MTNTNENRRLRSNSSSTSNLAHVACDLQQILRGTDDPSFHTTFRKLRHDVRFKAISLKAASDSGDEDLPPSVTQKTTTLPEDPQTIPELLICPHLRASARQTTKEGTRCIYVFEMDKSFIKAAVDAFSYEFQSGDEEAKDDLGNVYFILGRLFATNCRTVIRWATCSNVALRCEQIPLRSWAPS